ncbi:hypothetical protein KUTeg_012267, partial [Tegillarca granosa]
MDIPDKKLWLQIMLYILALEHTFLQRWPDLKIIKPRSLEIAKAKSATQSAIDNKFDNILTSNHLKQRPQGKNNVDDK